jgi:hypothetical protein
VQNKLWRVLLFFLLAEEWLSSVISFCLSSKSV